MEEQLFQPRSDRPMHVAAFGSGTGTILRAMLAAQKREKQSFAIRLLYTDRECHFQKIAKEESIPLVYNPFSKEISREEYDRKGLEMLFKASREIDCPIDFLLLAGYMRLMSSVWLQAFSFRILNIHPADLTVLDSHGKRKYIGENGVFKALQAGESRTRTNAILIDESVDGGPILVSGPWVPYEGGTPITKEEAAKHQNKQKELSDWPACLAALTLVGSGRVAACHSSGKIYLDGKHMPIGGYEFKGFALKNPPKGSALWKPNNWGCKGLRKRENGPGDHFLAEQLSKANWLEGSPCSGSHPDYEHQKEKLCVESLGS